MRDLRRRRARERRNLALIEGVRLVEEALAAGVPISGAIVSSGLEATPRGRVLKRELENRVGALVEVSEAELAELSATEHPQGVVAVIRPPRWVLSDIQPAMGSPVVVLDGLQDPGNVGTIVRTAHGLGAAGVVALPGTAELGNPKTLRSSMGALFKLASVRATTEEFLNWRRDVGLELWVGDPIGAAVDSLTPPPKVAIAIGNEGAGISPELMAAGPRSVAIPIQAGAESLNAATAAAILVWEVVRGR